MYPMGKSAEIGQLRWDPLTCASDRPNGTLLRARIQMIQIEAVDGRGPEHHSD